MATLSGLRIAVYARFSSANQHDRSIDDQVRVCREHIEKLGGEISDGLIFADYAVSGASRVRAGFDQVLKLIEASSVDVVVTESGSRLSRDIGDADRLWKLAAFKGVRLLMVNDGIDSAATGSRLQYNIKALMADEYLTALGKETRRGLMGAAKAGTSTGGHPYGYTSRAIWKGGREPDGYEIVIDPEKSKVVVHIFELYRDGHSLLAVAERLNLDKVPPPRGKAEKYWRKGTVRQIIRNRAYLGEWSFGRREWTKDPISRKRRYRKAKEFFTEDRPHLRIISDDLWDAVEARLKAVDEKYKGSKRGVGGTKAPRPFSGILTCGLCGRSMVRSGGSSGIYYKCGGHHAGRMCSNKFGVREDILTREAVRELHRVLTQTTLFEEMRARIEAKLKSYKVQVDSERAALQGALSKVSRQVERLVEFITDSDADSARDAIVDELNRLTTEKKAIERRLGSLKPERPPKVPTVDEITSLATDIEARLKDDPVRAREVLRRMLDGGTLKMTPMADGRYLAESAILPLEISRKAGEIGSCAGAFSPISPAEISGIPYVFYLPAPVRPQDRERSAKVA